MKNKILNFIVNFIKSRNVTFYIAFGVAVLSFILGIVASTGLSVAGASAAAALITLFGFLLFIVFSLLGYERAGAATVGVTAFAAIVVAVCECYSVLLTKIMDMSMTGFSISGILAIDGVVAAIVCVVGLLICAVASNVFAYLRLRKKDENVSEENAAQQDIIELTEEA
ncbi:MAG: hypothetical protein K2I20_06575 [Clostridia bacterium]|nr:hypothetical protein [Clostridia bacterium]MDE6356581.1 hypothetical protein [Clostridia bacterium]MDE7214407.1 hypothetical protein [Clostridia bacterium]